MMTATKRARRAKGTTYYSEKVSGAPANYEWPARFDVSDGYVGITQFEKGRVKERVLLSPAQYRALVAFVERGEHA